MIDASLVFAMLVDSKEQMDSLLELFLTDLSLVLVLVLVFQDHLLGDSLQVVKFQHVAISPALCHHEWENVHLPGGHKQPGTEDRKAQFGRVRVDGTISGILGDCRNSVDGGVKALLPCKTDEQRHSFHNGTEGAITIIICPILICTIRSSW